MKKIISICVVLAMVLSICPLSLTVVSAEDAVTPAITSLVANPASPTKGTVKVADYVADHGVLAYGDRDTMFISHVGSALQGATMILTPVNDHRNDANAWSNNIWLAGGKDVEYFNFTANAAGTVIVLNTAKMQNFIDSGWATVANNEYPTLPKYGSGSEYLATDTPEGYTDRRFVRYDWTPDRDFYLMKYQVNQSGQTPANSYFNADGTAALDAAVLYPANYVYAYAKDFAADETVSVPVPGIGNSDPYLAFVVWGDNDYVENGTIEPTTAPTPEPTVAPTVDPNALVISNVKFKGTAVAYGENEGNGSKFMYGDMSNSNMSFQHDWYAAVDGIPEALAGAKYFTTGSDFTNASATYDSYISFEANKPIVVVGMYNADGNLVSASNFAQDGWTVCTSSLNASLYNTYKWLRGGRTDYWNMILYKEFPAGTVNIPPMKIASCYNYGGFAAVAVDDKDIMRFTTKSSNSSKYIIGTNLTPGVSLLYGTHTNTYADYTSSYFSGASYISTAKWDNGSGNPLNAPTVVNVSSGQNGEPYWITFKVTSGATVYMTDPYGKGWPNNDGSWKNDSTGLTVGGVGSYSGETLYYKHFDAMSTVEIPSYGKWAGLLDGSDTATYWEVPTYIIVWDEDAEPTPEPTPAPTPEPTPAPTPEPTVAPTANPNTPVITNLLYKGTAPAYGENEQTYTTWSNGDKSLNFMYGDMSNPNMSFMHSGYSAITNIPKALDGAKYFTAHDDFTVTAAGNYLEFTVDKPVIVVGMISADAPNSALVKTYGWNTYSITQQNKNEEIYNKWAWSRGDGKFYEYLLYKEFPAGKVEIPYLGTGKWASGGGFAVVVNHNYVEPTPTPTPTPAPTPVPGKVVSNLVYGGSDEAGAKIGSGLADGVDTNSTSWWTLKYAGITGTEYEGAWYIQLPGNDKSFADVVDEYVKFDIGAPATVYIGTNWNEVQSFVDAGWTKDTTATKWGQANAENYYSIIYTQHFDEAGTVVIPSAGQALNYIFTTIIVFDEEAEPTPEPVKTYSVSTSTTGGTIVYNQGEEDEADWATGGTKDFAQGSNFTLTAVPDEGWEFVCWINEKINKIVSYDETYAVSVGSSVNLKARFKNTAQKNTFYVTFKNRNAKIIDDLTISESKTIKVPANPYVKGYTFTSWLANVETAKKDIQAGDTLAFGTDITEDTIYTAQFTVEDTEYKINVVNGTLAGGTTVGNFKYNEKVTVTADKAPEGQVFSYWTKDGEIVSYNATYSFYAGEDVTVEAVYEAEAAQAVPVVMMLPAEVMSGVNKISFVAERSVPEGYSVVESGILLTDADDEANFVFEGSNVKHSVPATTTTANAQFTIRKANVGAGVTWYGRAYLIYKNDATGEIATIHSNIVSGTLPAAQ